MHWIRFDAHAGQVLRQSKSFDGDGRSFLGIMLSLHRDLFAGLPGELFMGLMAILFVIAVASGAVACGPFMRKLDFGTVRAGASPRLKWLDLHNMIGVVTLAWALVVGLLSALVGADRVLVGVIVDRPRRPARSDRLVRRQEPRAIPSLDPNLDPVSSGQAAATRGSGSAESEGCTGWLSMVTSLNPTALS
jgi:uncharacterized iron-regulated membrane protein